MTQQRMTTLISKTSFLPAQIRKNIEKVESEIRRIFEDRGLQLSPSDFAAFIEQVTPLGSKKILSYALDILRPFTAGLGLRVARLSDTQAEIVIPNRSRNLTEDKQISEAIVAAAATEAVRHLWLRHAPLGNLSIDVQEMTFKKFQSLHGTCRVRMELSEAIREKVLAQLRSQRSAENESQLSVFDDKDQKLAELSVKVELKWTPALSSSKE